MWLFANGFNTTFTLIEIIMMTFSQLYGGYNIFRIL